MVGNCCFTFVSHIVITHTAHVDWEGCLVRRWSQAKMFYLCFYPVSFSTPTWCLPLGHMCHLLLTFIMPTRYGSCVSTANCSSIWSRHLHIKNLWEPQIHVYERSLFPISIICNDSHIACCLTINKKQKWKHELTSKKLSRMFLHLYL